MKYAYRILDSHDQDHLQRLVESYMSDGWSLAGGVSCSEMHYFQAVMKYVPEGESP